MGGVHTARKQHQRKNVPICVCVASRRVSCVDWALIRIQILSHPFCSERPLLSRNLVCNLQKTTFLCRKNVKTVRRTRNLNLLVRRYNRKAWCTWKIQCSLNFFFDSRENKGGGGSGGRKEGVWSGDTTRNVGYGLTESQVTIELEDQDRVQQVQQQLAKERPVWMVESTVEGASNDAVAAVSVQIHRRIFRLRHQPHPNE